MIKTEFTNRYKRIIEMLYEELDATEVKKKIFEFLVFNSMILKHYLEEQLIHKDKYGQFSLDRYMPALAGTLRWMQSLCARLNGQIDSFKALQHPYV